MAPSTIGGRTGVDLGKGSTGQIGILEQSELEFEDGGRLARLRI
jgi:hypothetical protein